jgi:hypothetical protein
MAIPTQEVIEADPTHQGFIGDEPSFAIGQGPGWAPFWIPDNISRCVSEVIDLRQAVLDQSKAESGLKGRPGAVGGFLGIHA